MGPHLHYRGYNDHHIMPNPTPLHYKGKYEHCKIDTVEVPVLKKLKQ